MRDRKHPTSRRRRWILTGLIVLIIAGVSFYFSEEPAAGAYLCPECYGFKQVEKRFYADNTMNREEIDQVQTFHLEAGNRVRAFWETFDQEPLILVCGSDACDQRMRYRGAKARAYGDTFILVYSQGRNAEFFAHELSHIELFSRLGNFRAVSNAVPAWFNEGIAVLVSQDERFVEMDGDGTPRCKTEPDGPLPVTFKEWSVAAGDRNRPLYAMAACQTLRWMKRRGGRQGVLDAIARIAEGHDFPSS